MQILGLLFLVLALSGCHPLIEVVQPAPAPHSPVATVAPDAHDVAILGVDFDPPLDYSLLLSNGGVTLLVAIVNRGQQVERDASLTARLVDPSDQLNPVTLLYETIAVGLLQPGEVRVVRFPQVTTPPPAEGVYNLVVELNSPAGDQDRCDNERTYNIVVRERE